MPLLTLYQVCDPCLHFRDVNTTENLATKSTRTHVNSTRRSFMDSELSHKSSFNSSVSGDTPGPTAWPTTASDCSFQHVAATSSRKLHITLQHAVCALLSTIHPLNADGSWASVRVQTQRTILCSESAIWNLGTAWTAEVGFPVCVQFEALFGMGPRPKNLEKTMSRIFTPMSTSVTQTSRLTNDVCPNVEGTQPSS